MEIKRANLSAGVTDFFASAWPTFIWSDPVMQNAWPLWFEFFPEYQFCIMEDGQLLGLVHAVPLKWDAPAEALPDGRVCPDTQYIPDTQYTPGSSGWDWVMAESLSGFRLGVQSNTLSAAAIVIAPSQRGRGLASKAVEFLRTTAAEHGMNSLIAPLRPTKKRLFPNETLETYMLRKLDGTNESYDPWLRLHVRLGARVIKPCRNSIQIKAPLTCWQTWTGMSFPVSGRFNLPGGDAPLIVDTAANTGFYAADGIWVEHRIH